MKRLAIIGAAGLGRLITHHAEAGGTVRVAGYYDDYVNAVAVDGRPLLGSTARVEEDFGRGSFDALAIGIGYRHMASRAEIFRRFKGRVPFANVIHVSTYVDRNCRVGEGIVMLPGGVVDAGVCIEDNVLLNTGVVVAHDSRIGSHSFLGPGVRVAGVVTVGECCFVGIGATIIDGVSIAPWSIVGAGAVVIRDTESYTVSVGVPARVVRRRSVDPEGPAESWTAWSRAGGPKESSG